VLISAARWVAPEWVVAGFRADSPPNTLLLTKEAFFDGWWLGGLCVPS